MKGTHIIKPVKLLLAFLFFAVLACAVTANSSQAAKKGGYKYRTVKGGVEITGYTGKDKNVKIPDKIAGKKVLSIGRKTFSDNKTVKKVIMPDTVETIRYRAFEECMNLKEVKFSKKLKTIETEAFRNTGLTQCKLPDSVKNIGAYVFCSCRNLKKVHLGKNIKIIKGSCFEDCTKLSSINLENIEEIGQDAFKSDKSITGVLNLSSVTTISENAFYGCSGIKEVNFTDSLQLLGGQYSNPFAYCTGIERFTIPQENGNYTCVDGVIYGKSDESLVAWPARKAEAVTLGSNVKKIYSYAFSGAGITSIAMEGDVNHIGEEAFAESMVTQVTLPLSGTVKDISVMGVPTPTLTPVPVSGPALTLTPVPVPATWSSSAFDRCSRLVKVVFPEKSVLTNNIAFRNCTSLREVVLPDTMMQLSDRMFLGCTSLESITIPKNITNIPQGCFYNCSRLKNINLENIGQIGVAAFSHCSSLEGTLTLNAEKIGALSFEKCTGIKEVKFNKPLSRILYDEAIFNIYYNVIDDISSEVVNCLKYVKGGVQVNPFAGCTALTSISVPEGGQIRSIDGVLYSADMKELVSFPAALTGKFNIPYGVETICLFAFQDSALTELVTANSVRSIRYHALNGSSIKSLTISKGVNNIGERALDGCMQLESIKVHASNKKYESEDGVLYEKMSKGSLLLYPPARKGAKYTVRGKAGLASYSFNNCKYLKKVVMPEGVAKGNETSFYNCKNIKLYLPKSMKSYKKTTYDRNNNSTDIYAFDETCKGCRMYVKKKSPLAKYFDKNKVKYKTY